MKSPSRKFNAFILAIFKDSWMTYNDNRLIKLTFFKFPEAVNEPFKSGILKSKQHSTEKTLPIIPLTVSMFNFPGGKYLLLLVSRLTSKTGGPKYFESKSKLLSFLRSRIERF